MWLKILILILFAGVLVSLGSSLRYLLKDMGVPESKRTLYVLGIRITLAALMMLLVFYGLHAGILSSQAPWDTRV